MKLSLLSLSTSFPPFLFLRVWRVLPEAVIPYRNCTLAVRAFSRGIPYNPEGTIQDFTCSPRHVGLEKLLQEKDEALYGRPLGRNEKFSSNKYSGDAGCDGADPRDSFFNENAFSGPLLTTRNGTRSMLAGGRAETSSIRKGNLRRGGTDNTSMKEERKGGADFSFSEAQYSDASDKEFRSGGGVYPSTRVDKEYSVPLDSPHFMQQFYAEASMSSAGDTYRQDCRTDPRFAHLPPHVRSAQQSILDMQHDSFGESIRGMVPPPPQRPAYSTWEEEVEFRAFRPPKVLIPAGWGLVVGGFLAAFSLMGLYGN